MPTIQHGPVMIKLIAILGAVSAILWILWSRGRAKVAKPTTLQERNSPSIPASKASVPSPGTSSARSSLASSSANQRASMAVDRRPLPYELASFKLNDATSPSDNGIRLALKKRLKDIPRPPRSFQRLLSPNFLATVTSEEFADFIMGEPLIAAKVLARVNSPMFGLHRPVVQVGQAITFLGLNNVRAICVQYMLDDTFKADSPDRQKIFDDIWNASAIASDLSFRIAQKLRMSNPGVISTHAVLSFVGHLAAAALLPLDIASSVSRAGMLERAKAEQEFLVLPAGEFTRLLMEIWELPDELIEGVSAVDRILVTSADNSTDQAMTEQAALCYLCARLGELLVQGQIQVPLELRDWNEYGADFFHLAHHLELPVFAQLQDALRAADLNNAIKMMLDGMGKANSD